MAKYRKRPVVIDAEKWEGANLNDDNSMFQAPEVIIKSDGSEFMVDDMGSRPEGGSIERKDNNGDYTPSNCIWATKQAQARNRRTNRIITIDGKRRTLIEWCATTGIGYQLAYNRLKAGWPIRAALFYPVGIKGLPHQKRDIRHGDA